VNLDRVVIIKSDGLQNGPKKGKMFRGNQEIRAILGKIDIIETEMGKLCKNWTHPSVTSMSTSGNPVEVIISRARAEQL